VKTSLGRALDLVIGSDGSWGLLKVNPRVSSGFVEDKAGVQLTATLTDLLGGGAP